tara:strand:+ start:10 stop:399 length:390 start_codon:yes stop_codon:yes gene_type:complete
MSEYIVPFYQFEGARLCKKFEDDCVVRSISIATNKLYKDVFRGLMMLGLEMGAFPDCDIVWIRYLEEQGFVKNRPPRVNGRLIKLGNWIDRPKTAVVRNSRHLTALSGGIVTDSWDCRYRPVNSYWTKE